MKMPRFTFAEIAATLPFIQANGVVMPYNQTKENIHKKFSTNKRSTHSPTTLWPIGWRSTWSFFVLEWLLFFSLITFSRWEFFLKKQRQFPKWKPIIANCVWKLPIYANSWVMNFYLSLFSSLVSFSIQWEHWR